MIDDAHRQAGTKLAGWLVKNFRPGEPLHVIVVCTGNSRRSILGATLGNIAAAYYGMPEVKFHSGGTAPTAFNARTISVLKAIGVVIEPMGKEAKRGQPQTANPVYRVRWGDADATETAEFSKLYSDSSNPRAGFAALMVCSEADAACPFVRGASLRVSMPYQDPKIFDGSPFEIGEVCRTAGRHRKADALGFHAGPERPRKIQGHRSVMARGKTGTRRRTLPAHSALRH